MERTETVNQNFTHSVTLDKDLCKGCTNCVKRCPTEAIRVRNKTAVIIKERCIDCGECIRVCPYHAKKAVVDPLSVIEKFEYSIALPAPTLYGQFTKLRDRNVVLTALKQIGFDDVFEVSAAAEAVSAVTPDYMQRDDIERPIISSACPTVLRIIRARFPSLIPHLLPYRSPMELAARWAKNLAVEKTGLPREKIACVFISPCPAKATSMRSSIGTRKSEVDAVIAINEVYVKLRNAIRTVAQPEDLARSGEIGVGWAISGGEAAGTDDHDHLAADGMENVIQVLEALEDDRLKTVNFIELNACVSGCVGGVLTVENPFIARARIKRVMAQATPALPPESLPRDDMFWEDRVTSSSAFQLDDNLGVAMVKLAQVGELETKFPGMDCGACGAPSCRALAEDIVSGYSNENSCIFLMREKLQSIISGETKAD